MQCAKTLNRNQWAKTKRGRCLAKVAAIALMSFGVLKADRLDTLSWNFQLAGGGGGSSAVLNLTTNLEIYCNDFNNEIFVPHSNYSATLSGITSTTFNKDTTRFGEMTSSAFNQVTISDGDANDITDEGIINGAGALARYQMAGYLVSQYGPSNMSAYNNGIQMAIWQILDPTAYSSTPLSLDPSVDKPSLYNALEMAAEWYHGNSQQNIDAYLSNFRIVSDSTMTCTLSRDGCANTPRNGGFQEQITRIPEPASDGTLAFGLVGLLWVASRARGARGTKVS